MSDTAGYIASAGFPFPLLLAWLAAIFEIALVLAFLTGAFFSEAALLAGIYVIFLAFAFHGPVALARQSGRVRLLHRPLHLPGGTALRGRPRPGRAAGDPPRLHLAARRLALPLAAVSRQTGRGSPGATARRSPAATACGHCPSLRWSASRVGYCAVKQASQNCGWLVVAARLRRPRGKARRSTGSPANRRG